MKHGPTQKGRQSVVLPERVPTSGRCFFARESEESSKGRTQMTVQRTGALSGNAEKKWKAIDWQEAQRCVRRLQMRIAKAVKEGRHITAGLSNKDSL